MKKNIGKLLFILGIIIPIILGFRFLMSSNHLVWGDAPFFYKEGLKELFFEPFSWTERGNALGGINSFLWLSPWMILYGVFGTVLNLGNDLIIRILFYIPSIVLSVLGPIFLGKYLKLNKITLFFSSLFYVFNTYYLLILDGGQVGIALAYGTFPFLVLFSKKLVDKVSVLNFFLTLLFSFIVLTVDPRFYVIGLITVIVWQILEAILIKNIFKLKGILYIVLTLIILIPLNFYWIYPYLKLGIPGLSTDVTSLQLNSLLNMVFLYQPHWFSNIFGKVSYPPFYFVIIPILLVFNLFLKNNKKFLPIFGTFLFLAFFAKGSTPPLEEIFYWFVKNVPFAESFRDSSKFFTPLFLLGGFLVGNSIERLHRKYSKFFIIPFSFFIYLLFLVSPLFLGKFQWNLSNRNNKNLNQIYELLKNDSQDFFRSAWFYEKSPLSFETNKKPSLNAKELVDFRPFSALNAGSYDALNFMHQGNWQDWFRLLGIKYLIFSGNSRQVELSEKETLNWNEFLDFVDKEKGLTRIEDLKDYPTYQLNNTNPEIFGVEKLFLIVGADDIYEKIEKNFGGFSRSNQGFIFTEDGVTDLSEFLDISSKSAVLVYNSKNKNDLEMNYFKEYFVSAKSFKNSQWSTWNSEDYLEWKFQLLTRGVDLKEFDYKKGIAFSTEPNEIISYSLKVPKEGEYIPVFRILSSKESEGVWTKVYERKKLFKSKEANLFSWDIQEPIFLNKGKVSVDLENTGGLNVVNTFALIPKEFFDEGISFSDNLIDKFEIIDLSTSNGLAYLINLISNQKWSELEYTNEKILSFDFVEKKEEINWIILSQRYNPNWQILIGDLVYKPLPFYSVVNGFYVDSKWQKFSIKFKGQEDFRWGVYVTTISTLLLIIIFITLQDERKNN